MSAATFLNIPVFAGQGAAAADYIAFRKQAQRDATSSAGSLLLTACFEAFRAELSCLSQVEILRTGIDLSNFKHRNALLDIPPDCYLSNPILTGTTLFLFQSLRYLAYIETSGGVEETLAPFSDVLKGNREYQLGVLGFSSGILPAVVVATSFNTISYISRSVEAYRLAFWIGVRVQPFREKIALPNPDSPWSLVFSGLDKKSAEEAIIAFDSDLPLGVTAVLDGRSVTISGRPDVLEAFSRTTPSSVAIHKTTVNCLYHFHLHSATLQQLLCDVVTRGIAFPNYADIRVPIRSTLTGLALSSKNAGSIIEAVIEMIITQPVNWDLVVEEVVKAAPMDKNIRLLNVGPGTGLTRNLGKSFSREHVSFLDLATEKLTRAKQNPIAIVGMGVHMPGARSVEELWHILEDGINTISEVPEHRFKVSDYNNPKDPKTRRQMKASTGNFIDGVDEFDNKFFKISPREARSMDPQQRILLQVAYEALESAGYVPDSTSTWQKDGIGCYIGVATHDYGQNLRDEIDVYYSTGTLKAFLSGRISYALQLSGPSVVVDTACSSSAVAVYHGCRALMNGDCSAAIVGGVNVISSPDMMLGLDRAHFLSPTGQCKAFDASADGYSRSEGCGVFVLKKLSDAIEEHDNILGVIRGIEVNQSGLANSITHPHAPTQAALFRTLLENTGIEANRVSFVEAHGTGTQAGDSNELQSIRSVFAIKREQGNPLHIGSFKASIGHLEAASGSAGLAKLLLMFKYHIIPRVISLENLNPLIAPLDSDNTIIDTVQTEWTVFQGRRRIAVLNNFGAAGSNVAMLLEESRPADRAEPPESLAYAFGLSAKTESALEELRNRYIRWLESPKSNVRLADIAYTMTARRCIYEHRIAVQASTQDELMEKLKGASPVHVQGELGKVVFVFSAQGGQYLGMGKTLYQTSEVFRKHINKCHSFLVSSGFVGVTQILLAGEGGSGLAKLEELEAYQVASFSLEYSIAKMWMSWGLIPAAVIGHSLGEYAALVISGVLSLRGALCIVANRARFMFEKCAIETTGMVSINASPGVVSEAINSSTLFSGLNIACYNSTTDCVVSGPISLIEALRTYLDRKVHCKHVLLSVPFGYHGPAMMPLLQDLTRVAKKITINAPTIPVVSNVFGNVVAPGDDSVFNPEYFARHCAEPVQFDTGVRSLVSECGLGKFDAWLEIGPHTTTLPLLKANASLVKDSLLLCSLKKQQPTWSTLATACAQLYLTNLPIKWRQAFSHVETACIELPSYPFERSKFWVPFKESEATAPLIASPIPTHEIHEYKMLGAWVQYPSKANGNTAIFETLISDLAPFIRGHTVAGTPLCPASVYFEQVLAGIGLSKRHLRLESHGSHVVLRNIEFTKPLVYDESVARTITTTISSKDDSGFFSIVSRFDGSEESTHAHGEYRLQTVSKTDSKFKRSFPLISRQIDAVQERRGMDLPEVFSGRTAYEVIFPRVVDYSKEYHTMQSLTLDTSGMEGVATIKLPADHDKGPYAIHPVFMDTLLHVAGFMANLRGGVNDAFICTEVGTVKVIPELIDPNAHYIVYVNHAWIESEGITAAEVYAVLNSGPRRIVAHLKGVHFRCVRLHSLKKSLSHAAGKTLRGTLKSHAQFTPVSKSEVEPAGTTMITKNPSFDLRGEFIKVVAETCSLDATFIDADTDLYSLGVDSLMSIEIFGKLQGIFQEKKFDIYALSHCQSVNDFIREIENQTKALPVDGHELLMPTLGAIIPPAPVTSTTDDVFEFVRRVVSETCRVDASAIGRESSLDSLGVDSLMSIEVLGKLRETFPAFTFGANALQNCRSISDIIQHVPLGPSSSGRTFSECSIFSPRTLVALQEKLSEPPSLNVNEVDVKMLLADILEIGIEDMADDADFESLGLDSLTSIEALGALEGKYKLELPGDFFSSHRTVKAVQSYLDTHVHCA
ncbi:hypothetical protein Agabi119p4_4611 [Agaricus bisporus var. burnettii]|uniref:Polyketide synthase n=1 Tax=Agaricus bisporus var. burnettii TaxID=192524 RepID=A0A8H7F3M9_AGABI|nr:hypothetical protein Agabi119p4_4611 [Agaricus bisporus var. burnettii]